MRACLHGKQHAGTRVSPASHAARRDGISRGGYRPSRILLPMTTLISDAPARTSVARRTSPDRARLPEHPILAIGDGAVVALRQRRVLDLGGLAVRGELEGTRLVSAHDLANRPWWIPAAAVWSDAETDERPEHPRSVGMATDHDRDRAVLTGLSDRLGWEALHAYDHGASLATLDIPDPTVQAVVFDGRVGHDVPTVVVIGDRFTRWGAGATVESAYRRAMFHDVPTPDATRELADMARLLADAGLEVAVVDLGTPLMQQAGISRVSVQLMPV